MEHTTRSAPTRSLELAQHALPHMPVGGIGTGNLTEFAYGDIPFLFTALYPLAIGAAVILIWRNVSLFGCVVTVVFDLIYFYYMPTPPPTHTGFNSTNSQANLKLIATR